MHPGHADDLVLLHSGPDVAYWYGGELLGRGGPSWIDFGGARRIELGWAIREQHRGHGYATEIGRAGLAFAFDKLAVEEVVAFTEVHNQASRAVMARLGMLEIGQIYRPGLIEGREGIHASAPFSLYRISREPSMALPG